MGRSVVILGTEVEIKDYICSRDGGEYRKKPQNAKLQLVVTPTAYCDGHCPFCCAGDRDNRAAINLKHFERLLLELKEADIVRGVSFTGGEPFSAAGLLDAAINMVYDVFGFECEVAVNTNGTGLRQLDKIHNLEHIDAIHISRHHYDDVLNRKLFGIDVPGEKDLERIIKGIGIADLFVMNCLLLKDYIGTADSLCTYLEHAAGWGAGKAAFITPMGVNAYAESQAVDYRELLKKGDGRFLFTRSYCDYNICCCQDGVYVTQGGELIEFYGRTTRPGGCGYARGLNFGPDSILRAGYGGREIVAF